MPFDDPFDRFRTDALRASDAEREQTADALRRSHTDGRLTDDEFEQRLSHCYRARTRAELDRLVADLPRERELSRRGPSGWLAGLSPVPVPALILGGLLGLWLLGTVLGALLHPFGPIGPYGYRHGGPPWFVPLIVAAVAWRWFARRRRAGLR